MRMEERETVEVAKRWKVGELRWWMKFTRPAATRYSTRPEKAEVCKKLKGSSSTSRK